MNTIIEIEGGEGSGKSTLIAGLKEHYSGCVFTREPGGIKTSEEIRSIIVNREMDPATEALLFAASRQELVQTLKNEVRPIFFDRYFESTLVYQGLVKGLPLHYLYQINQAALNIIKPNVILYLDIEPEKGLERISVNNRETNRFDKEKLEFHQAVRKGFLYLASIDKRYAVINASKNPQEVLTAAIGIIDKAMI